MLNSYIVLIFICFPNNFTYFCIKLIKDMIKRVFHCADIHIRNVKRHEEYRIQLDKFVESIKENISDCEFNEMRIVVAGDIFHQKIQTSNEQTVLFSRFLKQLSEICPVILIAGNHDYLESNKDRMDSITPIIKSLELPHVKYLDFELDFKSGIYYDDNIAWCLYSIFDGFKKPDIETMRVDHPNKKFIGLFHGALTGSKTDTGFEFEHGVSLDIFEGCDVAMCGDIHKRQELNLGDILVVYPGSLIQQDRGESVSKHGYLIWDIENMEYDEVDLESDYGFYKFKINSIEELEEGLEEFVNF